MQIKITINYHCTPIWPEVRQPTISTVGEDMEELEISYAAGGNAKWYNLVVSLKIKYILPV